MLGFSLIEVMISLLLSMLLMFGVTNFYQHHKYDFIMIHALARLQEHARIINYLLTDKIAADKDKKTIRSYVATANSIAELPVSMRNRIIPNSDILQIQDSDNRVFIYVARTARRDPRGNIISALYQTDMIQHTAELVPGVDNMHLQLNYCDSNEVCLVRIKLLLVSAGVVRKQPQRIKYNNKIIIKTDGRYYQAWNMAIATN